MTEMSVFEHWLLLLLHMWHVPSLHEEEAQIGLPPKSPTASRTSLLAAEQMNMGACDLPHISVTLVL